MLSCRKCGFPLRRSTHQSARQQDLGPLALWSQQPSTMRPADSVPNRFCEACLLNARQIKARVLSIYRRLPSAEELRVLADRLMTVIADKLVGAAERLAERLAACRRRK